MIKKMYATAKKYRTEIKRNKNNTWKDLFFFMIDFPKWVRFINTNPLDVKLPWINYRGIAFLNKTVTEKMNVFEYGSGGSTKYWIEKGANVYSVEHDREWYDLVLKSFADNKVSSTHQIFLKEPEQLDLQEYDISNPDHYVSSGKKKYKNYATAIDQFDNCFFDIVLVDGRARPSCVKHAVPKIRKGGYLVLDNSDREYYTSHPRIKELLGSFEKVFDSFGPGTYTMLFWQTTIWKKK